jgi:hypothetical protein
LAIRDRLENNINKLWHLNLLNDAILVNIFDTLRKVEDKASVTAGINDYNQANDFLAGYLPIYNHKFAVQPACPVDSHEPLRLENDLDWIFTKKTQRKLSKDLSFQYERVIYQIQTDRPVYALQGREVTVLENDQGKLRVILGHEQLAYKRFYRQPKRNQLATGKDIEQRSSKPAPDHPWRTYGNKINGKPIRVPN